VRITNSQKGFTLLEVMVAMGIMGVAAVGGMRLMNNQMKSAKTVETRFEYGTIVNEIREILGDRNSCRATFNGRNIDNTPEGTVTSIQHITNFGLPTQVTRAKYPSNTNPALATTFGNGTVKILGYRLTTVDGDPTVGVLPVGTATEGSAMLLIRFAVAAGGGGAGNTTGTSETVKKIKLNVQINAAARTITECSSTGAMADLEGRYVNVTGDTMTGNLRMGDATTPAHIIMLGASEIDFQSDKRLKHEITDIKTLSEIRKIRPVHYKWKKTGTTAYGVIAQELALIYPDLVHKRSDDFLAVNYMQLTPIMLRGIQEVDAENRKLKTEIKELKDIIKLMKQDICKTNPQASSCK
jgi:prepilin-type N-terminal cleavage/methylation domain-containing protein